MYVIWSLNIALSWGRFQAFFVSKVWISGLAKAADSKSEKDLKCEFTVPGQQP